MGLFRRSASPFWWMNIRRPGQRSLRRSTGVRIDGGTPYQTKENRTLAKAVLAIEEAKFVKAQHALEPAAPAVTLAHFWHTRCKGYIATALADHQEITRRIETLFLPTLGALPLDQIRPGVLAAWRQTRTDVADDTIRRDITALRTVLARARTWQAIATDPLEGLDLDLGPGRTIIRYLLPDEATRLRAALDARDRDAREARRRTNAHRVARQQAPRPELLHYADALTPMVLLALHTGVRQGELFQLEWSAIDTHSAMLTVTAQTAKGRKQRYIPLNREASRALAHWQAQTGRKKGLIFPSPRTGETFDNVQSSWEVVLETADIDAFRWHDLRHTFASWLVQRGVSLRRVQQLMGHASIKTTERYAHLAPAGGARADLELLTAGAQTTDDA